MNGWRARAACRGVDVATFFPEKQRGPGVARGGPSSNPAVTVCMGCDVQRQCLLFALAAEAGLPRSMRFGIFGGATPAQRHTLDADPRRQGVKR